MNMVFTPSKLETYITLIKQVFDLDEKAKYEDFNEIIHRYISDIGVYNLTKHNLTEYGAEVYKLVGYPGVLDDKHYETYVISNITQEQRNCYVPYNDYPHPDQPSNTVFMGNTTIINILDTKLGRFNPKELKNFKTLFIGNVAYNKDGCVIDKDENQLPVFVTIKEYIEHLGEDALKTYFNKVS